MPNHLNDEMTAHLYAKAIEKAQQESLKEQCTKHVNPVVSVGTIDSRHVPYVSGFAVSDWYEPNTLMSYTNGIEN